MERLLYCDNHEVDLTKSDTGRKDAIYTHRVVFWDKDFKMVGCTEEFSIMGGLVEFCGLAQKGEDMYMTYGFQDNAAYLLKFQKKF